MFSRSGGIHEESYIPSEGTEFGYYELNEYDAAMRLVGEGGDFEYACLLGLVNCAHLGNDAQSWAKSYLAPEGRHRMITAEEVNDNVTKRRARAREGEVVFFSSPATRTLSDAVHR